VRYVIFDLEATCWRPGSPDRPRINVSEIIEIGAVMLDEELNIISEFAKFVRPTINPKLSTFCKELTTITQKEVDNADTFAMVINQFASWAEGCRIMSWGGWDKKQIERECLEKANNGPILNVIKNHTDYKRLFASLKQIEPCGMDKALRLLDIPLDGTHHRGIDDAKNIAKIFVQSYQDIIAAGIDLTVKL
jgi:3'-5' exoribonuclease 1